MNRFRPLCWNAYGGLILLCLWLNGCASVSRAAQDADRFMKETEHSVAADAGQPAAARDKGGAGLISAGRYFASCPEIAAWKRDWLRQGLELKLKKRRIFPKLNVQFANQSYIAENSLQVKNITEGGLAIQYKVEDLLYYSAGVSLAEWQLNRVLLRIRKALQDEIVAVKKRRLKQEYVQEALDLCRQSLAIASAGAEIAGLDALNDPGGEKTLRKMEWQSQESALRQAVERDRFNLEMCRSEYRESAAGIDGREWNEGLFSKPAADEAKRTVLDALADHAGFKLAWGKRVDVMEAEAELAAREVELASAGLAWFKFLAVSVGFGKYYVFKDNDFARFNLRLSLNFPVLDYGETGSIRKMARQDRDHAQQRILALARKLHAELDAEVRRMFFLQDEWENERDGLRKQEGLLQALRLEFAARGASGLLLLKKMELDLAERRRRCREQRYQCDLQELQVHFLLGVVVDAQTETSIIDEIIDVWQKE
jgi:hypothetical protein